MKRNNFDGQIFYRGVSGGIIPIIKNSSVIVNIDYSSCTKRKDVLESFTDESVLVFSIPNTIKTYEYIEKGKVLNEAEVLIQRNTQFKIIKQLENNPNYYLAELSLYTPTNSPKKSIFDKLSVTEIDLEERRRQIFEQSDNDDLFKTDSEYEDEDEETEAEH